MSVYIYTYIHTPAHTCTHTYIYTCTHSFIRAHAIHANICAHINGKMTQTRITPTNTTAQSMYSHALICIHQ